MIPEPLSRGAGVLRQSRDIPIQQSRKLPLVCCVELLSLLLFLVFLTNWFSPIFLIAGSSPDKRLPPGYLRDRGEGIDAIATFVVD